MIGHLILTKDDNVYSVREKAAECIEGHCRVSPSWLWALDLPASTVVVIAP